MSPDWLVPGALLSFRDGPKDQTRNLEIPGSTLTRRPGMTMGAVVSCPKPANTAPNSLKKTRRTNLMNILPGNMRFGAGQPVKRLEDQRLLTGMGQFIDDRPEDGALWLHVLRSPHAHAKIVSIDTKPAAEMPGVEAVYSGADLIAHDIGTIPTLS